VIPDKANPCWREMVTGKRSVQTQMLGLQMILKRMQRHLASSPDDAAIQAAAHEVHGFFLKYESSLSNEIKSL
jgi:hypothetical protein